MIAIKEEHAQMICTKELTGAKAISDPSRTSKK